MAKTHLLFEMRHQCAQNPDTPPDVGVLPFPTVFSEALMARTDLHATPQLRAAFALHKARTYRHHRDCQCRMWQREDCTQDSARWIRAMNKELEAMAGHADRC